MALANNPVRVAAKVALALRALNAVQTERAPLQVAEQITVMIPAQAAPIAHSAVLTERVRSLVGTAVGKVAHAREQISAATITSVHLLVEQEAVMIPVQAAQPAQSAVLMDDVAPRVM